MKNEKLKIGFLIIGSFLFESGFYWLTSTIIGYFSSNNYLPSIIFLIFTFLNYLVILPIVSLKLLTNPQKVFVPILLSSILFNIATVIGSYTYLCLVIINPNYMSLCFLFENFFANGTMMNIIFYGALAFLTFSKPLMLKLVLNMKSK